MVPLLLRQVPDASDKILRLFEILELIFLPKMVFVYNLPSIELRLKRRQLLSFQRRYAAAAGDAVPVR
jgi:hypothetical protein